MSTRRTWAAVLMLGLATGCGGDAVTDGAASASASAPGAAATSPSGQLHPDILEVVLTPSGPDTYDIEVTVSSPYDTPEQYADGWRVLASDGTVLGEHTLLHDHANEQPFTRVQSGVKIPADVREITVEGRDQRNGYGGRTRIVTVPR